MSRNTVYLWEEGDTGIDLALVERIAAVLDVAPIDLLYPGELPQPIKVPMSDEEIIDRIRQWKAAHDALIAAQKPLECPPSDQSSTVGAERLSEEDRLIVDALGRLNESQKRTLAGVVRGMLLDPRQQKKQLPDK